MKMTRSAQLSAAITDLGRLSLHGRAPERRVRRDNVGGGTLNVLAATEASPPRTRPVSDELVIAVDASAVGEHAVDGDSAVIHARSCLDPRPPPGADATATAHPKAAPAAPERVRPGPPHDAAIPEDAPARGDIRASRWPFALKGLRRKPGVRHDLQRGNRVEAATGDGGPDGGRPTRPRHRSRGTAAAAAAAVLVIAGGGTFLLVRPGSGSGSGPAGTALAVPRCTTKTATTRVLAGVHPKYVAVDGMPFAVVVGLGRQSSQFSFVSAENSVVMLTNNGSDPTLFRNIQVPGAPKKGEAITKDGRYLFVASGDGADVISIPKARDNAANPFLGDLDSKGTGAVQVAISPDDKYAFVTLQGSSNMAVFDVKITKSGFRGYAFDGFVPLDSQPVGVAQFGGLLYVTSWQRATDKSPSEGTVSVVSMKRAETRTQQGTAVLATALAGCRPSRVVTSPDGRVVWVTAQQSNALLAFNAAWLRANRAHPLIANVPVGPNPIGEKFIKSGAQIVVANSGSPPSLMVVNTRKALAGAGKLALVGSIPTGRQPHEFNQTDLEGGKTLLVTDRGSGRLEAVSINDIP